MEVISDNQKREFNSQPCNKGRFINVGLWKLSRHPNYVGEIVLWTGATIYAMPFLSGWQYIALICPVFSYLLLRYVSGVPMLEKKSDKKWGEEEEYQKYKRETPILFPFLSAWSCGQPNKKHISTSLQSVSERCVRKRYVTV